MTRSVWAIGYVAHYRDLSTSNRTDEVGNQKRTLIIFYTSAYGNTARMAEAVCAGAEERGGVRVSLCDLEGGEIDPFVDLIEDRMRGLKMRIPVQGLRVKLIPTEAELAMCRDFGRNLSGALLGEPGRGAVIGMADLG